jgi:hypothetical protein
MFGSLDSDDSWDASSGLRTPTDEAVEDPGIMTMRGTLWSPSD